MMGIPRDVARFSGSKPSHLMERTRPLAVGFHGKQHGRRHSVVCAYGWGRCSSRRPLETAIASHGASCPVGGIPRKPQHFRKDVFAYFVARDTPRACSLCWKATFGQLRKCCEKICVRKVCRRKPGLQRSRSDCGRCIDLRWFFMCYSLRILNLVILEFDDSGGVDEVRRTRPILP